MTAGQLRERVEFQKRGPADDGAGNKEGGWLKQFSCTAKITPLKGGEEVTAARLQGVQPAIIRVRVSSQTRAIDSTWRVRDERTGAVYQIKTKADMDQKRAYFDMMCEAGASI